MSRRTSIRLSLQICFGILWFVPLSQPVRAQSELGDGFVLIAPIGDSTAYLLNGKKEVVHKWECGGGAGNATYLLPDGSLLRTGKIRTSPFNARGGAGGQIKKIAWDGTVMWDYTIANDRYLSHHDVEPMPNGNVLAIAWEHHSRDAAIEAGRRPDSLSDDALWPETILELKPVGTSGAQVVWQWRLWDHLIQQADKSKKNFGSVADHPERVDINFAIRRGGSDWIHMNAVDYNAELDQLALSARWFDEVWVIDHTTTTSEAASQEGGRYGHGGDLLYRWGNPEAYFGGFPSDRQFFAQHDVRWIDANSPGAGNFMVFNNGDRRSGREYSSVNEFRPPMNRDGSYKLASSGAFAPEDCVWSYSDEGTFFSDRISGAQRLPGGNTLICSGGQGWVFEVTKSGDRVWEFRLDELPTTNRRGEAGLFRAPFYPADYPAFQGKKL